MYNLQGGPKRIPSIIFGITSVIHHLILTKLSLLQAEIYCVITLPSKKKLLLISVLRVLFY